MGQPRFGTDGIRGIANAELTPELALAVGRAAARVLDGHTFIVGRDTRRSGPLLQAAFCAGIASEGVDVVDVGVLTTPGVAFVSEVRGVPAGVLSASHNPFEDNGIKLFAAGGAKLATEVEAAVERELEAIICDPQRAPVRPTGARVGMISPDPSAVTHYREHLRRSLEGRRLEGLKVVIDCANGAASEIAPDTFESLGAEVTALSCRPDGCNVNDRCGSSHPGQLTRVVRELGADLGLAFDGDADRLVAVDHTGAVADGDVLLALFAGDLAAQGRLAGNAVVVTVMSNLGFRTAMTKRGITVREVPVGDRAVLETLESEGLVLGGEQSGHIVFRDLATTGDGILTGLAVADLVVRAGQPLAELCDGLIERVPQVLVNVAVGDPGRLDEAQEVWDTVAEIEAQLGGTGRVVLRPSGTEPVIRVMVEATDEAVARRAAGRLCSVVEETLGKAAGSLR